MSRLMRLLAGLALVASLAACATVNKPQASPETLAAVAYRAPGPARLTFITMINNRSGAGAHTALMINGSERVIFDPAGSFQNPDVAHRDDVLYGVTPAVFAAYRSAHARASHHVVTQSFEVTPEQAEAALRLAKVNGQVSQAYCTASTVQLIRQVPGFEDIRQTMFPTNLMRQLAVRPGVVTRRHYEDDEGTILDGVAAVQL